MVGYRESKYSFNDPMDQWEQNFRNQKPSNKRVLKQGYMGLLRSIFTGGRQLPDTDPNSYNFWKTVPTVLPYDGPPSSKPEKKKKK